MKEASPSPQSVGLGEIFTTFFYIGATSFGGGVVAYLREHLVNGRGWLDDEEFLTALEISQTLPGLNSTNMSVIIGNQLRGGWGALVATLGMILPGAVTVSILGYFYLQHGSRPEATAILLGVAAAAVGLLLAVTLQVGRKQLRNARDGLLIAVTFVAIVVCKAPLILVLLTVGPVAIWMYRPRPDAIPSDKTEGSKHSPDGKTL